MSVGAPEVGQLYLVTEDVPALCCEGHLPAGTRWEVVQRRSKNRLMVKSYPGDVTEGSVFHRVKRSTFRMRVDPAQEAL